MKATRRSFLKSGAITILMAGIALDLAPSAFAQSSQNDPTKDFPVPFEAQQSAIFYFKQETFEPYLGGVFKASAGAKTIEMTLEEVRNCAPSPQSCKVMKKPARPSECFALVFRSTGTLTDLTTIYDIEHAALGKFALFMTRRDGPGGKHFYEAVFNRAL